MTDPIPKASYGGLMEEVIVRSLNGAPGYILIPSLIRIAGGSPSIPSAYQVALLPFRGDDKPIKAMSGFDNISLSAHVRPGHTVTAAHTSVYGAFRNGAFARFVTNVAGAIGAFRHTYTEAGEETTRILLVMSNGSIVDSVTGNTLTTTGVTVQGASGATPEVLTFTVSPSGRALILEFTLWPEGPPSVRNCFRLDVDFAREDQVISTAITDATPYGTEDEVITIDCPAGGPSITSDVITRTAEYPVTYGFSENETAKITASENYSFDDSGSESTTSSSKTITLTRTISHELTITLPNSASRTFTLLDRVRDITETQSISGGDRTGELSWTDERSQGTLGIIYSDPTSNIFVYEYNLAEVSSPGSGGSTVPDLTDLPAVDPDPTTITYTRTVGIMYGEDHRVLFTETNTIDADEAGLYAQNIDIVGYDFTDSTISIVFPLPENHSTETRSDDITSNGGYIKKLKWVTDPVISTDANRGWLLMRDVADLTGGFANNHRYWVAVKDSEDWVVGVSKRKNLNGDAISEFAVYANKLNETTLRQRIIDYLIEALNAAPVPDVTAIADLTAVNLTPYEVRLSSQSRIGIR